jgi:cytochrome c oxidase assembly protein subunit 15
MKHLRRLAWISLLSLVLVVGLSAFMRHVAAGLGCQPWPTCHAQYSGMSGGAGSLAVSVARLLHRVVATGALLLAIALLAISLRAGPRLRREAVLAAMLLVLALGLAVLGVFTAGSRLPAVALGNLLGGFMMLAIAARLVGPPVAPGLGAVAASVAILLVAHIASGALVSASQAGLVCGDLRACAEQAGAAGWPWRALNPWFDAGLPQAEGALVQWVHRVGAIVVTVAVAALGWRALRAGRRSEGRALLLLLALQAVLGLVVGSIGLPLGAVLLHNLASALLLALVVRLI